MSQAVAPARKMEDSQRPAGGISARIVFNAVRRHPLAFVGVILFAVAASLGIWFFLPLPKRTAAVVFHVSSQSPSLLATGPVNAADFASYKQSQMALIKGRRIFNAVLKENIDGVPATGLEVFQTSDLDPLTWLDKNVTVDSKTGSDHIRVTVEGDNGPELQGLLTALQKVYLTASFDRDNGVKVLRLAELEKSRDELRAELKKKRATIDDIARLVGTTGGAAQLPTPIETQLMAAFTKAVEESAAAELELEVAETELKSAKFDLDAIRYASQRQGILAVTGALWTGHLPRGGVSPTELISEVAIAEVLRQDAQFLEYESAVARARQDLQKTEDLVQGGPANKNIELAKTALRQAEERRDAYRIETQPRILSRLKERAALMTEAMVGKSQNDRDRAKGNVGRADKKVQLLAGLVNKGNGYKLDLEKSRAEIVQSEKLDTAMTDEIDHLKLELKALKTQPRVSVADDPYIIQGIEGNRRLKYSLMAGLGVFVFGFGGLVMWEHRSRRVTRTEEVSTELGARLIGTIPPLVSESSVASSHETNTPLVEAIDTTRIMLTHAGADGSKLRVLMVTSAVSGEGKTTLSGNLAISLTRAGFRTLLIDGDMQAPSAHLLFGIADAPGLSELLRGESDLVRAVRPTPIPGLSVLPAGRWNMSTRQSLVGDRWRVLKKQLEEEFDFVVIDTSPLLMVSDAMLLAREADGVVLSVLLGVSQIARVAETVNRLHAIGAELAGVVVNNVQSEVYRRYMSRAKYAAPTPVAAEADEMAFAVEDEAPEAVAEEIRVEPAVQTKEGE